MSSEEKSPESTPADAQAPEQHEAAATDAGEQAAAVTEERVSELELALQAANDRANSEQEKTIRAVAEMENIRRRAAQDVEKAHKFALEKFANELLTTVDNLERALQVAATAEQVDQNFLEGIELTHKGLAGTLQKFGVAAVGEVGEAFNPDLHQAMAMQESAEHSHNTIMAVMQKGYTLSGRLLRPAMVMVARNQQNGVDTEA